MPSMVPALVRSALRGPNEKLNLLLFRTADDFDARLCRGFGRVYVYGSPDLPPWDATKVTPPANMVMLDHEQGRAQVPADANVDVAVCPMREPALSDARAVTANLHIPLVTLFVDVPPQGTSKGRIAYAAGRRGHLSVSVSKEATQTWGLAGAEDVRLAWTVEGIWKVVQEAAGRPFDLKWGFQ